jgi:hypothetical protein
VKTENQFGTGTGYALGAVTYSSTTESKLVNNVTTNLPGAATTNTMSWWDGAVTNASSQNKDNVVTNTSFAYGANGALTGVNAGGRAVTFVSEGRLTFSGFESVSGLWSEYEVSSFSMKVIVSAK